MRIDSPMVEPFRNDVINGRGMDIKFIEVSFCTKITVKPWMSMEDVVGEFFFYKTKRKYIGEIEILWDIKK